MGNNNRKENLMKATKTIRIPAVEADQAKDDLKKLYGEIERKMQLLPNIFKVMGNSPSTLKGYLSLSEAAGHTKLSPELKEKIALTVSQINNCHYCLSAHTTISKASGIPETDILQARKGLSNSPKEAAVLAFVRKVIENKGHVTDHDITSLKENDVSDEEIVEITLIVTQTIFTNYFNNIAGTEIDFPSAPEIS